jgi:hypothetical protein
MRFLDVDLQPQAPNDPHDGLCGRLAHLRSHAPQGHRHRQPADDASSRSRQRAEGSLCHAFAAACWTCCALTGKRFAQSCGCFQATARSADYPRRSRVGLPESAPRIGHQETDHPALAASCLRNPSAGIGHRSAHHSASAGPPQPGHDLTLPEGRDHTVCATTSPFDWLPQVEPKAPKRRPPLTSETGVACEPPGSRWRISFARPGLPIASNTPTRSTVSNAVSWARSSLAVLPPSAATSSSVMFAAISALPTTAAAIGIARSASL